MSPESRLLATCALSKVLWLVSSCVTPTPGSWPLEVFVGPTLQCLSKCHKLGPCCLPLCWEGRRWWILGVLGIPDPPHQPGETQTLETVTRSHRFAASVPGGGGRFQPQGCLHVPSPGLYWGAGEVLAAGFKEITCQLVSTPFPSGALHSVLRAW